MRRIGAILLLAAALAASLSTPALGSESRAATFKKCGSIPYLTSWQVEAKRVGCTRAREVVHAYVRGSLEDGVSSGEYGGFSCRLSGTYGDGGLYRCAAKGHRVIKFARGG
jgi:hypothetical protein